MSIKSVSSKKLDPKKTYGTNATPWEQAFWNAAREAADKVRTLAFLSPGVDQYGIRLHSFGWWFDRDREGVTFNVGEPGCDLVHSSRRLLYADYDVVLGHVSGNTTRGFVDYFLGERRTP